MTSYDPCTCYFESTLAISVRLIEKADIKLHGKLTGEIVTMNGTVQQNGYSFNPSQAVSEGKAAYKTYKNIKQWTDDQIRQALANAPNYKTLIKPVADAQGIKTMHLGTQDYYIL